MRNVVIASAVRTAIGSYGGSLASIPAVKLGAVVIAESIKRAGIAPDQVDEVIMGNVLQAGLGQNPARQASIEAGIPKETPSYTINKVCGSGLKAIADAATAIRAGEARCIVAGGMENMSSAPYLLTGMRWGARMGDAKTIDEMIHDGLWDAFNDYHMGITAENVAERYQLTRQELDAFAAVSQQRACAAIQAGLFADEIVPVHVELKKKSFDFAVDEYPRENTTAETLAKLRPAFKKDGVITAGNASGINDGAAALVIMDEEYAKELGIVPLARIVSYASAGVDPSVMGLGPVPASKKALKKAGWSVEDLDRVEANEAFVAQFLAVGRELGFDLEKVNVQGGATALGHPIGASGARILVTLLHQLKRESLKKGLATLCIGGGQGIAMLVERTES